MRMTDSLHFFDFYCPTPYHQKNCALKKFPKFFCEKLAASCPFYTLRTIYIERTTMTTTKPNYTREMPDQTKRKISQTMLGKNMQRSPETRKKISDGLKRA